MDNHLILLAILQVINLLVYRWVQSNFVSKPRLIQPKIFHNPISATLLVVGPNIIGLILVVLAFFYTDSQWLFLGLSLAGFIAFATPRK